MTKSYVKDENGKFRSVEKIGSDYFVVGEDEEQKHTTDSKYKEVKVTTLTGLQAEDIMTALRTGGGLNYRDVSVRGLCILEV